jgi:hypothetical protein
MSQQSNRSQVKFHFLDASDSGTAGDVRMKVNHSRGFARHGTVALADDLDRLGTNCEDLRACVPNGTAL